MSARDQGPAAAVALAALAFFAPPGVGPIVLALTIALFVVPHGALDALSLRGTGPWVAYLLVAAIVACGWWVAPVPSLALFFAVTVAHFAQGDAAWLEARPGRAARALARGTLPVALPGVFHADAYQEAIGVVLVALGAPVQGGMSWLGPLCWAITALALAGSVLAGGRDTWRQDATELGLLTVLNALASPLLSIGLYLALWHGWRHALRVGALRTGAGTVRSAWRAAKASRGVVATSVGGFLALIAGLALTGTEPHAVLGPTLALLSALTVPHVLVVTALDFGWADAGEPTPG